MDYIEVIKYLEQDLMLKNPPDFTQKLITLERLDSVLSFEKFIADDSNNKNLFLTYTMVSFNWIMKDILSGNPDMYALTNLQFKLNLVKSVQFDELTNYYILMLHTFVSSVALYYCDKSNEALAEFNTSIGSILSQAAKFWLHDFKANYMYSKVPQKFLDKKSTTCNCVSCDSKR
jgi:hypothetical protein